MEMTVGYGRKLRPSDHQYDFEHEEATVFFKGQVSDEFGEDTMQQIVETARTLFAAAKIRVLTELGLEFESDENGVVREVERQAAEIVTQFPGSTVVASVTPAAQPVPANPVAAVGAAAYPAPVAAAPAPVPMAPPAAPPAAPIPAPAAGVLPPPPAVGPTPAELVAMYMADPSQWWDNRSSKTADWMPDFRHKTLKLPPNSKGKVYNAGLMVQDFIDAGYSMG